MEAVELSLEEEMEVSKVSNKEKALRIKVIQEWQNL